MRIPARNEIDAHLARRLVHEQFPEWSQLHVADVELPGWDNKTFRLGDNMLVRLPSGEPYAAQVEKEQEWLPRLAQHLPVPIPTPLARGRSSETFPWPWSVYRWIDGELAATANLDDPVAFASDVAGFLRALEGISAEGGPVPGWHCFHRGGDLSVYDGETKEALEILRNTVDVEACRRIWDRALSTSWSHSPVWVHGDVALGNLLVKGGRLTAVIDFGCSCIGDPACDLVIAWTALRDEDREMFVESLELDSDTWARGRAWALWKALKQLAGSDREGRSGSEHQIVIDKLIEDQIAPR